MFCQVIHVAFDEFFPVDEFAGEEGGLTASDGNASNVSLGGHAHKHIVEVSAGLFDEGFTARVDVASIVLEEDAPDAFLSDELFNGFSFEVVQE